MILLLDQGNSRLKWMLANNAGETVLRGAVDRTVAPAAALAAVSREHVDRVFVASVAGSEVDASLKAAVYALFGIEPHFLSAVAESAGLQNGYLEPSRLGVDRWLAMLGARSMVKTSCVVVDAGTALTIDVIRADRHVGGFIIPGLSMQREALGMGTALVGSSDLDGSLAWGRTTRDAVANGTLHAVVAAIERALVELSRSVDDTCALLITGGDAQEVAALMSVPAVVSDDLVFRGMLVQWLMTQPDG